MSTTFSLPRFREYCYTFQQDQEEVHEKRKRHNQFKRGEIKRGTRRVRSVIQFVDFSIIREYRTSMSKKYQPVWQIANDSY